MRWRNVCLVSLLAALLSGATPCVVHAGAYDELVGAAGGYTPNVPDVPEPTPVYDDNSSNDNSNYSNDDNNNYGTDSGENTGSSFWGNVFGTNVDPVYEQQQREKRAKARQERAIKREAAAKKRREARADKEWEERQRKKTEAAARKTTFVPPPRQPRALPPSLRPPTTSVPAGTEAKALSENQFRMATLLKKSSLTAQEQELLKQLHDACRVLYARAILSDKLTAQERSRIKLEIPTLDFADAQIATGLAEQLAQIKSAIAANTSRNIDLIKKFNKEKFMQLAEQEAGEMAEGAMEGGQDSLERYLGAAKVSAAISQGDIPAAGKEVLDFLVGKLSSPQASMAVEGGRMYADTAFKALDDFMVKAMGAVGKDFNTKEFWQHVRAEMTPGQNTVMEFIEGPDGK